MTNGFIDMIRSLYSNMVIFHTGNIITLKQLFLDSDTSMSPSATIGNINQTSVKYTQAHFKYSLSPIKKIQPGQYFCLF